MFLAGGLFMILTPGVSALLHNLTTLGVTLNAMRPASARSPCPSAGGRLMLDSLRFVKYVRSFMDGRVRVRHPALRDAAIAARPAPPFCVWTVCGT